MPKFMKDRAIALIDGGIESYLLGLFGLNLPAQRVRKKAETKNAPVMGMFGAAVELFVKACLVQAFGINAMYRPGNASDKPYKSGTDCIEELKSAIRKDDPAISFIWKNEEEKQEDKNVLINYLNKFKLLQRLRANGLHAGEGCSKDVAVVTANEVYGFISLLSKGKKLKAYLKLIPAPETTIRDREAIIEDLSRRISSKNSLEEKVSTLRGMYIVLPYVPEIKPDWIDCFDKISVTPPQQEDVNYLMKTLQEAHSIYLLKNRGKDGIPVRIEPKNPDALPIAIQNIKRTLATITEQFNIDVLTANTRFAQNCLDIPIEDFLVELFDLGIETTKILQRGEKFTAQQAWPFVVSAYSTQGAPRPCWQFITNCDEHNQLISFMEKAKEIGNGYYKRRADTLIKCVRAYYSSEKVIFYEEKEPVFNQIDGFLKNELNPNPISPQFIKNNSFSEDTAGILSDYISGQINEGDLIEQILSLDSFDKVDKKVVNCMIKYCTKLDQRKGLVAVLRSDKVKGYHSLARKQMFFMDICSSGLLIETKQ